MKKSKDRHKTGNGHPLYNWILLSLVVIAVVWYIWENLGDITFHELKFNWILLTFGSISVIVAYLVSFFGWIRLTESFHLYAPLLETGKAYFLSQFGKYVPGKVGLLLVRLYAYQNYSKRIVVITTGIEFIAVMASACLLALISLVFVPIEVPPYIRWTAIIGSILCLFSLQPRLIKKIANGIFKLIKRESIEKFPSYLFMIRLVFVYMCTGLLYGLGFYLVLNAFSPVGFQYYMTITAAIHVAVIVGMAAVFAPSGIGVREGVLFLILPIFIPMQTVILGVVTIRLVATGAEIFLAGIFVLLESIVRKYSIYPSNTS
jgi:uncharacterized membrane protein YbhN (UPF0104 family)